jgi:hypothetical protein
MMKFTRITQNPAIMRGKACIRGMRVTVAMIVGQSLPAEVSMTCSPTIHTWSATTFWKLSAMRRKARH